MCQGYAFGIVQDLLCWCSNYAPSNTLSVSNCNQQCPGYPYEYCGSSSKSLYGYIALGPSASGTTGSSSQATSTVSISPYFMLFHFHFNFMTSPWSDIISSHLGEQYSLKLIIGKVIMKLERNRIYSDANRVFFQSNFSNPLIQVSTSSFISVVTDTVFGSITVLGTVTIDPTVTSTVSSFVCQQDCLSSTGKLPGRIQS